jgi:hypothetical protein
LIVESGEWKVSKLEVSKLEGSKLEGSRLGGLKLAVPSQESFAKFEVFLIFNF